MCRKIFLKIRFYKIKISFLLFNIINMKLIILKAFNPKNYPLYPPSFRIFIENLNKTDLKIDEYSSKDIIYI